MPSSNTAPPSDFPPSDLNTEEDDGLPVHVMSFNAQDASGSTSLAADLISITSAGGLALPVCTGILIRDTTAAFELIELDAETIEEQARTVLEDMDVDVFRIGFAGSPEALAIVAEIAADYEDTPVITQVPHLAWWERDKIEAYLDALMELVLPQTSVLVGNYDLLWRWLLPEWSSSKRPSPRDLAGAAAQHGVPYLVITSANPTATTLDTVVATPESVLTTISLDRLEGNYLGSGDTFCATLATLLANGDELNDAVREASMYVHRSLQAAYPAGMGAAMADRMFWAQLPDDGEEDSANPDDDESFGSSFSETRH